MRYNIPVQTTYLRPLDVYRDLLPVADLIEICFSSTLDPEGRDYLRHIRKAAADPAYLRWIPGASERVSTPLYGYVWEQDRHIVGNLSLIPIYKGGQWLYLIANVAVHPNYRRRGIARELTLRALDHVREHHVPSAWLQVRDDNQSAYDLYTSVGFIERSRRTTWVNSSAQPATPAVPHIQVTPRQWNDWPIQHKWLNEIYPKDVLWNLPFEPGRFKPDWWRQFLFWVTGDNQVHLSARDNRSGASDAPIGFISWEPMHSYTDMFWIAASHETEDLAARALLPEIRKNVLDRRRPININYPYGRAVQAFLDNGYVIQNTLIWMECKMEPNHGVQSTDVIA